MILKFFKIRKIISQIYRYFQLSFAEEIFAENQEFSLEIEVRFYIKIVQ